MLSVVTWQKYILEWTVRQAFKAYYKLILPTGFYDYISKKKFAALIRVKYCFNHSKKKIHIFAPPCNIFYISISLKQ
jgi:hypothetical protein